jgi:hypothetical protein
MKTITIRCSILLCEIAVSSPEVQKTFLKKCVNHIVLMHPLEPVSLDSNEWETPEVDLKFVWRKIGLRGCSERTGF